MMHINDMLLKNPSLLFSCDVQWSFFSFETIHTTSSINGDVVSYVNISNVGQEDGGVYRCEARNEAGSVFHSEEIFVTGPPFIKPVGNITVLAGKSVAIRCPVTGYPIQRISWLKGMHSFLPVQCIASVAPNQIKCILLPFILCHPATLLALCASPAPHLPCDVQSLCLTISSHLMRFLLYAAVFYSPTPSLLSRHINICIWILDHAFLIPIPAAISSSFFVPCIPSATLCQLHTSPFLIHSFNPVYSIPCVSVANMLLTSSIVVLICPLIHASGGRELPSTERHIVYENGTLIISSASRELDEGVYVCRAVNEKGEQHTRNIYVQVLSECPFPYANVVFATQYHCLLPHPSHDHAMDLFSHFHLQIVTDIAFLSFFLSSFLPLTILFLFFLLR